MNNSQSKKNRRRIWRIFPLSVAVLLVWDAALGGCAVQFPMANDDTDTPNGDSDSDRDSESDTDSQEPCPKQGTGSNPVSVSSAISANDDDAEEPHTILGLVDVNSSDIELGEDPSQSPPSQTAGLRFPKVAIPKAAVIQTAYLSFVAPRNLSSPANLTIAVQAANHADPFLSLWPKNISSRPLVSSKIEWKNVPDWKAGQTYESPDISLAIQKVICRSGWKDGNAIVVILKGTGERAAVAYDASPEDSATLHVTYLP